MATVLSSYEQKRAEGALQPDDDQRRAIVALDAVALALESYKPRAHFFSKPAPPPKGLYLYGGVGRGKSMVMDLFFAEVKIARKLRIHFHQFMLDVHDFLYQLRKEREEGARIDDDLTACADHFAAEAQLLCFDEFQVKDVADAMILGRLFTALFARGVTCVMTSNIAPDDLYQDGLQRDRFLPFIALLKERLDIFSFQGEVDYRLHRLVGSKVYFWPSDADAVQAMDGIFKKLSDNAEGAALDITVKGRQLHVPRAARQAAWFTFAELCEQPKSAMDYLELLKHFHVFIVEGVPLLTDMQRNAALRFVTLVDTLYDHHARLVMSAAALPDQLYRGEELAQVFPRTVSRLMEMQSQAYMAV